MVFFFWYLSVQEWSPFLPLLNWMGRQHVKGRRVEQSWAQAHWRCARKKEHWVQSPMRKTETMGTKDLREPTVLKWWTMGGTETLEVSRACGHRSLGDMVGLRGWDAARLGGRVGASHLVTEMSQLPYPFLDLLSCLRSVLICFVLFYFCRFLIRIFRL